MNIHFRLAEPSLRIVREEVITLLRMMEMLEIPGSFEYDY